MPRVILVEDDEQLAAALAMALRTLGHQVTTTHDGPTALAATRPGHAFDAMVLDVMMPDMDGFEVCRRIRATQELPVIMLTARTEPVDIVAGLEAGADDYVTKPVEPRVLDARIKAVLRRATARPDSSVVRLGDLAVNEATLECHRDGRVVELTPTEWRLLLELVNNIGLVLTRPVLLDRVWGYGFEGDSRIVDAAVQRLRAKIEVTPSQPELLLTVRGMGYRLVQP